MSMNLFVVNVIKLKWVCNMKKYQIRYGIRGQMPMYTEVLTEDKLDKFMERKDILILSVLEVKES